MNLISFPGRTGDLQKCGGPKIRDIGSVDGPVLAFGGPYSNLQALEALRRQAEALGIAAARIFCTGDIVAYGADPAATVALIRDWGVQVAAGNCEQALAADEEGCGCGFDAGTQCDLDARAWYAFTAERIDYDTRAWMARLPEVIRFRLGGRRVAVLHGAFSTINRFVFASTSGAVKRNEARMADADLVIAGHSGLPFTTALSGGPLWHNPGAVGLPANDGTPDVWYSILTPQGDGALAIGHYRLAYDCFEAARRMRAVSLPEGYARALETGLWPSDDILPDAEKALAGIPLNARRLGGLFATRTAALG